MGKPSTKSKLPLHNELSAYFGIVCSCKPKSICDYLTPLEASVYQYNPLTFFIRLLKRKKCAPIPIRTDGSPSTRTLKVGIQINTLVNLLYILWYNVALCPNT